MNKEQKARQQYAERVKAAVDKACKGKRRLICPGARIEELLGEPLANWPDEIMPLELLPTVDKFPFIGWTPDFEPVQMEQAAVTISDGKATSCIQVSIGENEPDYIVGWKAIRKAALTVTIAPAGKIIDGHLRHEVSQRAFADFLARRNMDRQG